MSANRTAAIMDAIARMLIGVVLAAATLVSGGGAARATDLVRIATASTSVAHGPLVLAMADPSIFQAHGLAIKVTDLRGASPNCIAALLSGAVELCQVGTSTGTDAIAEGAGLKAIAVLTGPINEIFLSAKAAKASGVAPDAPIAERIRALRGLTLTTAPIGTGHYLTLEAMLAKEGMSMRDIHYRNLGDVQAMIQSIRNGQIDGSLWTIGSLAPLLMDGSGVRWISMARGDVEEFKTLPYVTVFARSDWVDKNPDLVGRIHAAYAASTARLKTDPQRSSKLMKDLIAPDLAQDLWDDGFSQARAAFLDGARTTAASWKQSLDLQAKGSGKTYEAAAFDKVVIPAARTD